MRFKRPPRTDDELYALVQTLWGLTIPRHKVCIAHQAPFDAFAHAFFARDPQVLIHGSRGLSGKSVLMSVLGITNAVVWGADCNILGGSLAQSNNVLEAMQRAWDHTESGRIACRAHDSTYGKVPITIRRQARPGSIPSSRAISGIGAGPFWTRRQEES